MASGKQRFGPIIRVTLVVGLAALAFGALIAQNTGTRGGRDKEENNSAKGPASTSAASSGPSSAADGASGPVHVTVEPPHANEWVVFRNVSRFPVPPAEFCSSEAYYQWLRRIGAVPTYDDVIVKVASDNRASVVVVGLEVHVLKREKMPSAATGLSCPVGDSDPEIRTVELDVEGNPPLAKYREGDGKSTDHFRFVLRNGDEEVINVIAMPEHEVITWQARLVLSINGRREVYPVMDGDKPFVVAPLQLNIKRHLWDGKRWTIFG